MIDKILMRLGLQADGGRSSAHARRPSEPGLTGPTALSSQEKGL